MTAPTPDFSPEAIGEALREDDLRPATPDEIAWVRAQRITEPPEPEECRALPEGSGRCAYAGPDGKDACGFKCIYRGERRAN